MKNNDSNQQNANIGTYDTLKKISLEEVKTFFHGRTYNSLTECYGILTLGDLFEKESTGELKKTIFKVHRKPKETLDFYNKLVGIISLLKCKYLNEDPLIDENDSLEELRFKLDITEWVVVRLQRGGITNLSQLLKMIESNDYSQLYSLNLGIGKIKTMRLIEKVKIIYSFLNAKKEKTINEKASEITINEILSLYDELKRLILESTRLSEEIRKVQIIINNKTQELNNLRKTDNIEDYSILKKTSLIEVESFFSVKDFGFLISNGFLTLGDLFDNEFESKLNSIQYPLNSRLKIIATVKILRCKYLNEDPNISNKISYRVFESKLGISFRTTMFLHNNMGINKLSELLEMIENDDFIQLHQIEFGRDLIHKLLVLYNFEKAQGKLLQTKDNDNEISMDEIYALYEMLKQFIIENNKLSEQIIVVQAQIDEKIQKTKSFVKEK